MTRPPDARNLPELKLPAYGVANARLTFARGDDGAWSVSLTGRNPLGEKLLLQQELRLGYFPDQGQSAVSASAAGCRTSTTRRTSHAGAADRDKGRPALSGPRGLRISVRELLGGVEEY
jgi:hypothetical protein